MKYPKRALPDDRCAPSRHLEIFLNNRLTGCFDRAILYLESFLNTCEGGKEVSFGETFKALADPVRREILVLLREGRMSAGEIGSHFALTGASVSYHLNVLKKADLVRESRRGNFIDYELNTSVVEEVMLWLSALKAANSDREAEIHDEE